jgi:hypothetical protein
MVLHQRQSQDESTVEWLLHLIDMSLDPQSLVELDGLGDGVGRYQYLGGRDGGLVVAGWQKRPLPTAVVVFNRNEPHQTHSKRPVLNGLSTALDLQKNHRAMR